MVSKARPAFGAILYFAAMTLLAIYFAFSAVQGDYGVMRRAEVRADAERVAADLAKVRDDVARMENLTYRLSGDFLDLDLLDERARDVLGYARGDEIVLE